MSTHDLLQLLYGDGAWEVSKELTAKQKRTQARIGLATNAIGITAGTAATAESIKAFGHARRKASGIPEAPSKPGVLSTSLGKLKPVKKIGAFVAKHPGKSAVIGAGAGLGLQVANLAGDAVANRVLSREANKKVKKDASDIRNARYKVVQQGVNGSFKMAQQAPTAAKKVKATVKGTQVQKNLDVTWVGEISKMDTDKRQVFGWASIVELNGEPVVDLQGDYMTVEEIEKAAYDYVLTSRKGGNQHQREGNDPKHVSDMIESFLVTPEKKAQMGLPDATPVGWWVGFQVNDDDTWAEVKSGKKKEFSIHGSGVRKELVLD